MKEELTNYGISIREQQELKKIGKLNKKNIKKILKGTPIQHIIGYVDFYGIEIKVNKNVLIPRYETETLVEKTIKYIKKYNIKNPKILDLCTGSGCIAISLSKNVEDAEILAADISKKAIKVLEENIKINNCKITIQNSNLFKKINNKFDIIITNPPYIPIDENVSKTVKHDPKKALFSGKKGLNHIEKIIKEANKYLKEKAILSMEIHENHERDITKIIKNYFPGNIIYSFEKDLSGKTRYLFIFKNCE